MTIGIVGLGLIGGSFAKAFKKHTKNIVYGYDIDKKTIEKALLINAVDSCLTKENIKECNFIIITTYPNCAIDFLQNFAYAISKSTIVIDSCGTKSNICSKAFKIANKNGFKFVGGHPMAGTQFSGFKNSRNDMFKNANMILVPQPDEQETTINKIDKLVKSIRFKSITISTAEKHDEIIAYTSQLAHIVSNAYVKSPHSKVHKGFSAGSYKDLTRVAKLNPLMWTELFMENKGNLLFEVKNIITELQKYEKALENNNYDLLYNLLDEGSKIKEETENGQVE